MNTGTTEVAEQSSLLMLVVNFMAWFKCFTFLTLLAISTPGHTKTITLASDEWCPYICTNKDNPGYMVELTKLALEQAGYKVVYQQLPLSRAISLASNGKIDGILGLSADHILTYRLQSNSVVIGSFSYDYFVRKGFDWRYQGDNSLLTLLREGGRLGLVKDYIYSDLVARLETGFPNQVFRAHGEHPLRTLIAMANKDRLDVIIDSYNTVNYLTKTSRENPLVFAGSQKGNYSLFVGFSPSVSFSTIKQFDQHLENVMAAPSTEILLDKYHIRDWRDADKNVSQ